jgi:hypothetical protein
MRNGSDVDHAHHGHQRDLAYDAAVIVPVSLGDGPSLPQKDAAIGFLAGTFG